MKIRFVDVVCIFALIFASACKSDTTSQLKDKGMMITGKKISVTNWLFTLCP